MVELVQTRTWSGLFLLLRCFRQKSEEANLYISSIGYPVLNGTWRPEQWGFFFSIRTFVRFLDPSMGAILAGVVVTRRWLFDCVLRFNWQCRWYIRARYWCVGWKLWILWWCWRWVGAWSSARYLQLREGTMVCSFLSKVRGTHTWPRTETSWLDPFPTFCIHGRPFLLNRFSNSRRMVFVFLAVSYRFQQSEWRTATTSVSSHIDRGGLRLFIPLVPQEPKSNIFSRIDNLRSRKLSIPSVYAHQQFAIRYIPLNPQDFPYSLSLDGSPCRGKLLLAAELKPGFFSLWFWFPWPSFIWSQLQSGASTTAKVLGLLQRPKKYLNNAQRVEWNTQCPQGVNQIKSSCLELTLLFCQRTPDNMKAKLSEQ